MKETGLMFKAPLVRATLDDIKTQTRRVAKLPHNNSLGKWEPLHLGGPDGGRTSAGMTMPAQMGLGHTRTGDILTSPFGGPGDRIYVRETWCQQADGDGRLLDAYWYRATTPDVMHCEDIDKSPWRPSIHMPKAAARIWLEITGVRVERLQEISAADAKAEGIEGQFADGPWRNYQRDGYWFPEGKDIAPILSFRSLWESTGGNWCANPWVWVIDFKRAQAQKGTQ